MLWKALLIFTITTCMIGYPHAETPKDQLTLIAFGSIAAAALLESRGKASE